MGSGGGSDLDVVEKFLAQFESPLAVYEYVQGHQRLFGSLMVFPANGSHEVKWSLPRTFNRGLSMFWPHRVSIGLPLNGVQAPLNQELGDEINLGLGSDD